MYKGPAVTAACHGEPLVHRFMSHRSSTRTQPLSNTHFHDATDVKDEPPIANMALIHQR
jgi:hypothetical protein